MHARFCEWLRIGYDLVTQKTNWLRFCYEMLVIGYDLVTVRSVPGTIWLRAIWLRFGYEAAEKCGMCCKKRMFYNMLVALALWRRNQIILSRLLGLLHADLGIFGTQTCHLACLMPLL